MPQPGPQKGPSEMSKVGTGGNKPVTVQQINPVPQSQTSQSLLNNKPAESIGEKQQKYFQTNMHRKTKTPQKLQNRVSGAGTAGTGGIKKGKKK